jgi:hypothetical protein
MGRWIQAHSERPPIFFYSIGPGFLYLTDTRDRVADKSGTTGDSRYFYLEGLAKDIVLLADKIQNVSSLKKLLASLYPAEVEGGDVEEAVAELVEENILMQEKGSVLTLAIGSRPRTTEQLYEMVLGKSPIASEADLAPAAT